jgi:hypothetical protein
MSESALGWEGLEQGTLSRWSSSCLYLLGLSLPHSFQEDAPQANVRARSRLGVARTRDPKPLVFVLSLLREAFITTLIYFHSHPRSLSTFARENPGSLFNYTALRRTRSFINIRFNMQL